MAFEQRQEHCLAYDLACRGISWIDSDDEPDEEMLDVLELHRAVCGPLYCDYSFALQKAFTAQPILVSPMLGSLAFALDMVTRDTISAR